MGNEFHPSLPLCDYIKDMEYSKNSTDGTRANEFEN
jgi:hypothetical protein